MGAILSPQTKFARSPNNSEQVRTTPAPGELREGFSADNLLIIKADPHLTKMARQLPNRSYPGPLGECTGGTEVAVACL
jgi:hypothetical protein